MPVFMFRRFATVLILVSISTITISAQKPSRNPDEQPRKVKRELKKTYVDWIKDVDLILTQAERDAWTKLVGEVQNRPVALSRRESRINCSTWSR